MHPGRTNQSELSRSGLCGMRRVVLPDHVLARREFAFRLEDASSKYVEAVGAKPRGLGSGQDYGIGEAHPVILAGVTPPYGAANDFYLCVHHLDPWIGSVETPLHWQATEFVKPREALLVSLPEALCGKRNTVVLTLDPWIWVVKGAPFWPFPVSAGGRSSHHSRARTSPQLAA